MVDPFFLFLVLGLLGAERLLELSINHRHVARLRAQQAVFHPHDGFGLIVAVQVFLLLGTAIEGGWSPWSATGPWTWAGLGVAILAQGLRYWCIRSLGDRWSVRVITLPGRLLVSTGPYRFLKHPNYIAVAAEMVAVPVAFGALATAATMVVVGGLALARRIRLENRALADSAASD